jgi:uncharacterized protein YndB with AHSA1/START domain
MPQIKIAESAIVDASAEKVYAILADYHREHRHILPKGYFTKLEVQEGGYGDGTLFRVYMRVLGGEYVYDMRVTEPEPGRVLAETDINSGQRTTFTLTPNVNQNQTKVTITTTWPQKAGLAGLLDRLFTPLIMRRIYREELAILQQYAKQ